MRRLRLEISLFALALLAVGCGAGDYEVVRMHGGRAQAGRFVSSAAYEASLEASIAEEKGDWPAAVKALSRARDEDPDGPELQARLGVALCHVGKQQAGEFAIADALRIDPELEVGWTARARCKWMVAKTPADFTAVRSDLERALEADGDALAPAMLLVDLELRTGDAKRARTRAEEAVVLHPESAVAWRALAEVAALQGDGRRAVAAALRATALDDAIGRVARSEATVAADKNGVEHDALAVRGASDGAPSEPPSGACASQFGALQLIAARADAAAVAVAADGVRAACPELESAATMIELSAVWTPKTAESVEARALSAPSAEARRWGARMRLRSKKVSELIAKDALPRAADRQTLALHLAASAVRSMPNADATLLAKAALDLAPTEPTVARLVAEVARGAGEKSGLWRKHACALARTQVEKDGCAAK